MIDELDIAPGTWNLGVIWLARERVFLGCRTKAVMVSNHFLFLEGGAPGV